MDTIIIKIESTYVSLAQIRLIGGIERITSMRRAALPENMQGEEVTNHSGDLAELLLSALESSGMQSKNLEIYLGAGAERFAEYRYNEAADSEIRKQRGRQAVQELLEDAQEIFWRSATWEYTGAEEGLSGGAVFAAESVFVGHIAAILESKGYVVTRMSSSLVAFAGLARMVSDIGDRVLVVSAEKNELLAALLVNGKTIRLARFSQGTLAKDPADPLLPFITSETKVVLCGFESQDAEFRESLKKSGAAAVGSVNIKMKGARAKVLLSGELAYQNALFPGVFAAVAFPDSQNDLSYLPKERLQKKNQHAGLVAMCAAALAVALFICAVPPSTLAKAERENQANLTRLEDPFFADAAEKLAKHRLLVSEFTELTESEETLTEPDPSYASTIEEIKDTLLMTARIDEMFYEKGHGIFVDFTTEDAETFDKAKNFMNDTRKMSVYEPTEREEIAEGEWRIQIRITLTPSAWEAP